ncbi:hypothetical protein D3C71_1816310 [compost metagenome]
MQQRSDHQGLAMCARSRSGTRFDIETARADALHAYPMPLARWNPYPAVGGNDPRAIISFHLHQPGHSIKHLCTTMGMGVQQCAGWIVSANGQ